MNTPEQAVTVVDIGGYNTKRKSNEGIVLPMKDPVSGEDVGFSVFVRGQDADVHRKRMRHLRNQNQYELKKNPKYTKTAEVVEEEGIETIVLMIAGWTPFQYGGRVWVYSPEVAEEFILEFDEFRDQIETAIYERKLFLEGNENTFSITQSMSLAS